MTLPLPRHLLIPANNRVLAFLNDLSAHSDIAEVLQNAVQPLGDVQLFCPNTASYRYLLASTNNVIFGFAAGMHTVAFRLDKRMKDRALATGCLDCPQCGEEWAEVVHHLPDSDWPKVDVRFWALKSYVYARSLGSIAS